MPFQYAPYRSPFTNSIAETMLRKGDAAARASEQTGQIYGQAIANIGQTVGNAVTQATDPRQQLARQAVTQGQELHAGQQQLDALTKPYTPNGPQPEGEGPAPTQHPYLDDKGLYDIPKLTAALSQSGLTHLAPELLKGAESINESILKHQDYEQKAAQQQTILIGDMADGVVKMMKAGMPFAQALDMAAAPGLATKRFDPQQFAQVKARLIALPPEQQQAALGQLMDQAAQVSPEKDLGKDAQRLDRYNRVTATNVVTEPGKGDYTINGQRFKADGTPIGTAVPKQAEPPKVGSEEDFVTTYAKEKFNKPATALTIAEKSEALGAFKAANADQEVRAAALAQKNLATVLEQMKAGQQPTAEDAKTVADDLVNHRQSPSQVKLMFGTRGQEGQAFMLKVNTAAKAMDPTFNYEEAESSYQLAKSTGFQNTVRYMDSALESIPRLEQNAKNLGNGTFRTLTQIANAAKNQFNDTDLKRFKTDALLVGDEIAKILSGGGTGSATSDAKLKQATEIVGASDSVPAIAAAMQEVQALMGNRRRALTRGTYMEGTAAAKPSASGPKNDPLGLFK